MGRRGGRRRCGVCGRVREIRIRARDGRPDICTSCAPRTAARSCGVCGKTARIVRAATADSPAIGKCCYRLPSAICTDCGQERPCLHAHGSEPLCPTCTRRLRARRCLDCGELRPAIRRVDGGVICASCDYRRGCNSGQCRLCTTTARLSGGLCAACRLRNRIAELAEGAEPAAAVMLAPFLGSLAAAENPASMLRWLYTPGFEITQRLLAGEIELSHQALDDAVVMAPQAVALHARSWSTAACSSHATRSAPSSRSGMPGDPQDHRGRGSRACARLRDLAGRPQARPRPAAQSCLAEVRQVAGDRSRQACRLAARPPARTHRSAPGSPRRLGRGRRDDPTTRPVLRAMGGTRRSGRSTRGRVGLSILGPTRAQR